jgi:hypothetical protein
MAKLTVTTITGGFASIAELNDNFAAIQTAMENTLSRDGTTPNQMAADLDMNSNQIINLPDPATSTEPLTLGYGESLWGNASTYADAAAVSAAAASVSETNAAASEAAADADATSTAADAVSTAADAASTAADAIATAADRVQTGLDAAATAADVVSTNADVISTAADAAATAADVVTVAGIYDSFDDRYLGAKASDPTLDNDGNALLTGALYFNTTSSEMRIWSGSAWLTSYVPSSDFVAKSGDTMSGNLSIDKSYPSVQYYNGVYSGQGSRWATIILDASGNFCIQCYDAAETSIAKTWIFYPSGDFWGGGQVRAGASAPVDDYDLTRKDYVDKLLAFSPQFTLVTGADDVYPLLEYAQFGFTIDKAYYKTDSGTITAEVAINGTAVTGLSALSLTSTQDNSTATAANTVAVGDKVAITLSSNSSADTVSICLHCTRT